MADYSKGAVWEIRKLLWAELQAAGILTASDYRENNVSYIPIIPVQEQDTFKNKFVVNRENPLPYLVYDLDVVGYDTDWFICNERLTFKIYANSYNTVITITNLMIDLFRRFDDSAKTMNSYAKNLDPTTPFKYHYFTLAEANSPNPAEELAGRLEADIAITYAYSRDLDQSGRFA